MVGIHNNIIMRVGLIDDVSVARVSVSTPAKLVRSTYVFFFERFHGRTYYILFSLPHRVSFILLVSFGFFFFLILPLQVRYRAYHYYTVTIHTQTISTIGLAPATLQVHFISIVDIWLTYDAQGLAAIVAFDR